MRPPLPLPQVCHRRQETTFEHRIVLVDGDVFLLGLQSHVRKKVQRMDQRWGSEVAQAD